jgi:hypothetical protein
MGRKKSTENKTSTELWRNRTPLNATTKKKKKEKREAKFISYFTSGFGVPPVVLLVMRSLRLRRAWD